MSKVITIDSENAGEYFSSDLMVKLTEKIKDDLEESDRLVPGTVRGICAVYESMTMANGEDYNLFIEATAKIEEDGFGLVIPEMILYQEDMPEYIMNKVLDIQIEKKDVVSLKKE